MSNSGNLHSLGRCLNSCIGRAFGVAVSTILLCACGGGGGGSDTPTDQTAGVTTQMPEPSEAVMIIDSIPASDARVSANVGEFTIAHLGASDWQYEYDGDCSPDGLAVRRQLVQVSDDTPYAEVVNHRLSCELEGGRSYTLHVDVDTDGADSDSSTQRASLSFSSVSAEASTSVTVLESVERSAGLIKRLYENYVRNAALNEFENDIFGALGAEIVERIAREAWDEIGAGKARFATHSERVTYPSRKPDGSAAALSGMIVRPHIADEASFVRGERIIVLSHSTGSHPSDLDDRDVWYMLGNLLASRGYLVLAPDNWGNGQTRADDAPETYVMASRVAANSLDMIKAVRTDDRFKAFIDPMQASDLAVIGYSQGGHSGMALWLAHALKARDSHIREVYIGAGPYDPHRMLQGGLRRIAGECEENDPWCAIDTARLLYYVQRWTMPGYLAYLNIGLMAADVLEEVDAENDEFKFTDAFVSGYLADSPPQTKFDRFKAILQLSSFTNLLDLTGTVQATNTHFHLFHARKDRVVPRQNSVDLENTLMAAFEVSLHQGECNGGLFNRLDDLDETGTVHSICALEMFDRVMKDLQPVGESQMASTASVADNARARQAASAPWRALAEARATRALADESSLSEFTAQWPANEREAMAARLMALDTPAATELGKRLTRDAINAGNTPD